MSTDNLHQAIRSPEQYDIIHLESENEICLHALSILQTDHLSCFLPIVPTEDSRSYLINTDDCAPLSSLSFRDRIFVRRHIRSLISDFFLNIISSMDYSMSPQGILYTQDQLYFNRHKKVLSCVYLPLHSTLQGKQVRLSGIEEAWLDELFRIPLENKWISSQRLEMLYTFFRNDDEDGARYFVTHSIWKRPSFMSSHMKRSICYWFILLFLYTFFSVYAEQYFRGMFMGQLPFLLLLVSTILVIASLLWSEKKRHHANKMHNIEKSQRRKMRNAQILFPENDSLLVDASTYEFTENPVQLTDISVAPVCERTQSFTIWTKGFTVGLDSDCCDLAIDHTSVSLKHAFFGTDNYGFFVEDLHSHQGTFVNRTRIAPNEKYYLTDGDIIGIGKKEFILHFIRETKETLSAE